MNDSQPVCSQAVAIPLLLPRDGVLKIPLSMRTGCSGHYRLVVSDILKVIEPAINTLTQQLLGALSVDSPH